jgi:hypothetical protein
MVAIDPILSFAFRRWADPIDPAFQLQRAARQSFPGLSPKPLRLQHGAIAAMRHGFPSTSP